MTGEGAGALSGVRVLLLNDSTRAPLPGMDIQTDLGGRFEFFGVAAGTYTLEMTLANWQQKVVDGIVVLPGEVAKATVELAPAPPTILNPVPGPQLLNRNDWWGSRFGAIDMNEMPTNRTIWSLLENQGISTVTDPLDNGQLDTGTLSLFGAHGASWTENQYLLNGFNATDPYVTGEPLVDPDYTSLSSMTTVITAKPADLDASGTNLIIEPRQPEPAFHGQAGLFYSGAALQSDNMNPILFLEMYPGPERMTGLYDGNAQLGGALPIGGFSWPIFLAVSTQQLSASVPGFAAPIDAHTDHILIELTPYQNGGRRLNLLYAGQQVFNSRDGATYQITPSAATIRNDNFHQFQARWSDTLSDSSVFAAGFGVVHAIVSSGLENNGLSTSTLDWPLGTLSGAAPLAQSGERSRFEGKAQFQTVLNRFMGSHALAFGGDFDYSTMNNRWSALDNAEQITVNGAPAEVIAWNTPASDRQHVSDASLFVQDAWRPFRWLELPLGLRLVNSAGQADGVHNRINWTTLEPRINAIFPMPHLHSLVWHAGWSSYGQLLQGQYFDYGNPSALGGQILAWNGSETGQVLRVFGGPHSGIAPGLRRPWTDETSVGLDARITKFYQVRVRGWLRQDHYLIQSLDTGIPPPPIGYTPVQVSDPYVDDISGYGAYETLTLYNEKPQYLGHDFDTLSNGPGYSSETKGFDVEMVLFSGRNWEVEGSFTAMMTAARTNTSNSVFSDDTGVLNLFGDDPNSMVNSLGLTYFDRGKFGRFQAYYDFPWGIHAAVVVRYLDGLPYSPLLFVNGSTQGFNQGDFFVLTVPRNDFVGFRAEFNDTVDLRVSKKFSLWRGNLAVNLDVFNLLNQNQHIQEQDIAVQSLIVRNPTAIQPPRTGRIGVEWSF